MAGSDAISIDDFRLLVARTRLTLSDEQIEVLRPMYDHYARLTATLHGLDLGAEDLAVTFAPAVAPGHAVEG
jgi:hypothetical protein